MKRKICSLVLMLTMIAGLFMQTSVISAKGDRYALSSPYPYLMVVNKGTNVVTVYGKDSSGVFSVPKKAFICSTGADTPVGLFRTPNKFRWQPLMEGVWGQYCTQITGNILFHSVYYMSRNPADLCTTAYNNLGITCSHGCVRLTCIDAKWIYDNCPTGSLVKVINGTSKNDPLGKPTAMKIISKWDPTDPDSRNPWHKYQLKITLNGKKKIEYGTKIKDLKSLVTVTDGKGKKLNKKQYLKVAGTLNTKKLGEYSIRYTAYGKEKVSYDKEVTFLVQDTKKPVFSGLKNVTVERNGDFNSRKGVSAKMVSGEKLKNKSIKIKGASFSTAKTGTHKVVYTVKGTNKKVATKTITVTVKDTVKPVVKMTGNEYALTNVDTNATLEQITQLIRQDVMSRISVTDNKQVISNCDKWVNVSATVNSDGTYAVTISVTDESGNVTVKKVVYTVAFAPVATTEQAITTTTEAPQPTA